MPLRRSLAIALAAAAIGGPTVALAASDGAPASPSASTAARTAPTAEPRRVDTATTPDTADATTTTGEASGGSAARQATDAGTARVEPADPPERIDARLACRLVRDTDPPERRAGIACAWTGVRHPKAVGYRLWRAVDVPDPEHHRAVIFRTRDLGHTRHLDAEIRPGHTFHYALEVVGTDGSSLAWSNTVLVMVPPLPDPVEALRLGCEGVRADIEPPGVHRPGIACRWSPSTRPGFAFYRLLRGDGEDRMVVFRTDDREATHHLDVDVEPGEGYVYVVEAVAADGRVVGRSRPARAIAPPAGERP